MSLEGWAILLLGSTIVGGVIGLYRNFRNYYEPGVHLEADNFENSKLKDWHFIGIQLLNKSADEVTECRPRVRRLYNLTTGQLIANSSRHFQWSAKSVVSRIAGLSEYGLPLYDNAEQKKPQNIPGGEEFWIDVAYSHMTEIELHFPTWEDPEYSTEKPGEKYLYWMRFFYKYRSSSRHEDFYGLITYGKGFDLTHAEMTKEEYDLRVWTMKSTRHR